MKRTFITSLAFVAILGAGCAAAPSTPVSPASSPSQSPTNEQTSAGTPTTPTPSPTMNASQGSYAFPGVLPKDQTDVSVRIKTSKGDIVVKLLPDEGPNAASNFVYLIGKKYYDGLTFHRVIEGFMAQGGDPTGTGAGGPGYKFSDDPVSPQSSYIFSQAIDNKPYTFYKEGTLAMANSGANTNGSQFFIMNADAPMDGPKYSIFGHVIEGIDVVKQLKTGDVMTSVTIEK
jgi:cyclophilin family peptidyl-prolyl cis-trans isomerase